MGFDRAAVENHIALLHQLAANCGNGVLVLAPIWEGRNPSVQKFAIGQTKQMIDAAMAFDDVWGVNLYSCYATMRENLEPGEKGASATSNLFLQPLPISTMTKARRNSLQSTSSLPTSSKARQEIFSEFIFSKSRSQQAKPSLS